jgi:hypothetical protein
LSRGDAGVLTIDAPGKQGDKHFYKKILDLLEPTDRKAFCQKLGRVEGF